jgi:hypothetical protein
MGATQTLLEYSGIGRDRLFLGWVSAAEGQRFAELVREYTQQIQAIGPFDPEANRMALSAVTLTLENENLRWLMGMQRALTEKNNVYGEKLEPSAYQDLLEQTLGTEYQRSLIYLSLERGPLSVREIGASTQIEVPAVSALLVDLEGKGKVGLAGYEGRTPKFSITA